MGRYTLDDVGCYCSGGSVIDIFEFMQDHGFEGEYDDEFIDEVLYEGLDYLNDHYCSEVVYFDFVDGDLVLLPMED